MAIFRHFIQLLATISYTQWIISATKGSKPHFIIAFYFRRTLQVQAQISSENQKNIYNQQLKGIHHQERSKDNDCQLRLKHLCVWTKNSHLKKIFDLYPRSQTPVISGKSRSAVSFTNSVLILVAPNLLKVHYRKLRKHKLLNSVIS
jgi:hypothetical protein